MDKTGALNIDSEPQVDMKKVQVFHQNEDCVNFEDLGHDNGFRFWWATDLAKCLGYEDFATFRRGPLNKAMATCGSLGIPMDETYITARRVVDGVESSDVKMSRFGCYLAAMHGDEKKQKVGEARAYFAAVAVAFQQYLENANNIERLNIRCEISDHEKSLSGIASAAGVEKYGLFQNAGYRGMYNMNLAKLKDFKAMPENGKSLLDYMGKTELAANLFRITQTEERIRNDRTIKGQKACEDAAFHVGKTVRKTMEDLSGIKPEHLPLESNIKDSHKNLKQAAKNFKKLDGK